MTSVVGVLDELSLPLHAFLLAASHRRIGSKRRSTKNARKQKCVASVDFRAGGADLGANFGHHLEDASAFVSVFKAGGQYYQMLSVKAVANRCAVLVQWTVEDFGWCTHALFSKLLVPALADMYTEKTWVFDVVMVMVQVLAAEAKWPDDDVVRAQAHCIVFIADSFQVVSQLPTRVWLIARLRLHQFYAFELLMEEVNTGEALRTFVVACLRSDGVVRALIAKAMAPERRQWKKPLTCAADLIGRCKLDRNEFPEVARHKLINWLHYQVHRVPLRIR